MSIKDLQEQLLTCSNGTVCRHFDMPRDTTTAPLPISAKWSFCSACEAVEEVSELRGTQCLEIFYLVRGSIALHCPAGSNTEHLTSCRKRFRYSPPSPVQGSLGIDNARHHTPDRCDVIVEKRKDPVEFSGKDGRTENGNQELSHKAWTAHYGRGHLGNRIVPSIK